MFKSALWENLGNHYPFMLFLFSCNETKRTVCVPVSLVTEDETDLAGVKDRGVQSTTKHIFR